MVNIANNFVSDTAFGKWPLKIRRNISKKEYIKIVNKVLIERYDQIKQKLAPRSKIFFVSKIDIFSGRYKDVFKIATETDEGVKTFALRFTFQDLGDFKNEIGILKEARNLSDEIAIDIWEIWQVEEFSKNLQPLLRKSYWIERIYDIEGFDKDFTRRIIAITFGEFKEGIGYRKLTSRLNKNTAPSNQDIDAIKKMVNLISSTWIRSLRKKTDEILIRMIKDKVVTAIFFPITLPVMSIMGIGELLNKLSGRNWKGFVPDPVYTNFVYNPNSETTHFIDMGNGEWGNFGEFLQFTRLVANWIVEDLHITNFKIQCEISESFLGGFLESAKNLSQQKIKVILKQIKHYKKYYREYQDIVFSPIADKLIVRLESFITRTA